MKPVQLDWHAEKDSPVHMTFVELPEHTVEVWKALNPECWKLVIFCEKDGLTVHYDRFLTKANAMNSAELVVANLRLPTQEKST